MTTAASKSTSSLSLQKVVKGDRLDKAFYIALAGKLLDGLLETIGGLLLVVVSGPKLYGFVHELTQGELSHDPHDFIATHLLHTAQHLTTGARLFGAIYLLSHGVVKIVLVVALFKQRLWAYPWLIGFLAVFIVYQIYRLVTQWSWGLFLLTIFDIIVLMLTYLEYERHRHRHERRSRQQSPLKEPR